MISVGWNNSLIKVRMSVLDGETTRRMSRSPNESLHGNSFGTSNVLEVYLIFVLLIENIRYEYIVESIHFSMHVHA